MVKKIFIILLIVIVAAIIGTTAYIIYDNSRIVNSEYIFESEKVPKSFDGYRIVMLSDFHNADNYDQLAETVKNAKPDIICIVGDLVDINTKDFTNTKKLIRKLTGITTVYYTYGNHEMWSKTYNKTKEPIVKEEISKLGVVMMDNKIKTISKGNSKINLVGFGDLIYDDVDGLFEPHAKQILTALSNKMNKSQLSVLLFHRAQYFDMISQLPFDLVLSGHLHGGQVNIKFIRDKILQDSFGITKYVKGEYKQNGHEMIICGGTALKDGYYRIFNTPEIVTVELKTK